MHSLPKTLLKPIAVVVALMALMSACTSQTTSTAAVVESPQAESTPTTLRTEAPETPAAEPDPSRAPAPTLEPTATPTPPESDTATKPLVVDPTTALGVAPDAQHGYFATDNAWFDPVPCDAPPQEVLVGVDIDASTTDDIVLFAAGFIATGNVQQMTFSARGRAAALISCGESTETPWLQIIDFDAEGRVADVSPPRQLPEPASASGPYLGEWTNDEDVLIYVYPETGVQEVTIAASTGDVLSIDEPTIMEEDLRRAATWRSTPNGDFSFRVIDDPLGRPGCEHIGFMVTLEVDDGSGPAPAFSDPDQVFASASDLQFGPDNLVTWNSWCAGFPVPYVGRIQSDGTIANAHHIDVSSVEALTDSSTEYRGFRLSSDGFLVSVGAKYAADVDPQVALFQYDLASDPQLK